MVKHSTLPRRGPQRSQILGVSSVMPTANDLHTRVYNVIAYSLRCKWPNSAW